MNPEEKPTTPTKVFTVKEVVESAGFESNLKAQFRAALNPPPPPVGMKYKAKPWERIQQNGIYNSEKLWEEYILIKAKKSKLSTAEREFISHVVYKAMLATEKDLRIEYAAGLKVIVKPEPKKRKSKKVAVCNTK